MSNAHDLLAAFDALPATEQHQAAIVILQHALGAGEIPDEGFTELAAELFKGYDTDESDHADP